MRHLGRFITRVCFLITYSGLALYGAGAVYWCMPGDENTRTCLALLALAAAVLPPLFLRQGKKGLLFGGTVLIAIYGWYSTLKPNMDAPWAKDVAVLPEADVQGDKLFMRRIRDFQYRSTQDFDVNYYDKEYDLNQLQTVDLFLSYWGTTAIAHTIMSFGFANGDQLAVSIETRKEVTEEYSTIEGFFKTFELIYVVADERDLVGLRANHRGEDVYLYRLKLNPEQARKMLMSYVRVIDDLEQRPRFYNALVTNCTTSILPHIPNLRAFDFNWAMIANGYIDHWRYDAGIWGFEIPFEEFRRRSRINEKAAAAGNAADFSILIRKDVPSIDYFAGRPLRHDGLSPSVSDNIVTKEAK